MKKIILFLLALLVTGGAFAQTTVIGNPSTSATNWSKGRLRVDSALTLNKYAGGDTAVLAVLPSGLTISIPKASFGTGIPSLQDVVTVSDQVTDAGIVWVNGDGSVFHRTTPLEDEYYNQAASLHITTQPFSSERYITHSDKGSTNPASPSTFILDTDLPTVATLQEVTGYGNITTNPIIVQGAGVSNISYEKDRIIYTDEATSFATGLFFATPSGNNSITFPDIAVGTVAMAETETLDKVLNTGNSSAVDVVITNGGNTTTTSTGTVLCETFTGEKTRIDPYGVHFYDPSGSAITDLVPSIGLSAGITVKTPDHDCTLMGRDEVYVGNAVMGSGGSAAASLPFDMTGWSVSLTYNTGGVGFTYPCGQLVYQISTPPNLLNIFAVNPLTGALITTANGNKISFILVKP